MIRRPPANEFSLGVRATLGVVAIAAAFVTAGCGRKLTPAECTDMLDRYVEMTISADPALGSLTPGQAAAVREMKKAVKKAERSYRRVEEQCEREVRRNEYRCAMAAKTPNDWEACID